MADSGIRLRDVWEAHAKAQEREDVADLQRELNGLPGSKTKSFTAGVGTAARLSFEDKKKADEKRKKEDEERFVTTWLARMTESYRQAYERLSRTINLMMRKNHIYWSWKICNGKRKMQRGHLRKFVQRRLSWKMDDACISRRMGRGSSMMAGRR